jgi:hypothetical protein
MNDTHTTESAALTTTGIAGVIAGGGIVTFALFPFAIPFLLLTAVFAAPLVLLAVVPALAVGIVATVVLAIRAIGRRLGRRAEESRAGRARGQALPRIRPKRVGSHDTGGR